MAKKVRGQASTLSALKPEWKKARVQSVKSTFRPKTESETAREKKKEKLKNKLSLPFLLPLKLGPP